MYFAANYLKVMEEYHTESIYSKIKKKFGFWLKADKKLTLVLTITVIVYLLIYVWT